MKCLAFKTSAIKLLSRAIKKVGVKNPVPMMSVGGSADVVTRAVIMSGRAGKLTVTTKK